MACNRNRSLLFRRLASALSIQNVEISPDTLQHLFYAGKIAPVVETDTQIERMAQATMRLFDIAGIPRPVHGQHRFPQSKRTQKGYAALYRLLARVERPTQRDILNRLVPSAPSKVHSRRVLFAAIEDELSRTETSPPPSLTTIFTTPPIGDSEMIRAHARAMLRLYEQARLPSPSLDTLSLSEQQGYAAVYQWLTDTTTRDNRDQRRKGIARLGAQRLALRYLPCIPNEVSKTETLTTGDPTIVAQLNASPPFAWVTRQTGKKALEMGIDADRFSALQHAARCLSTAERYRLVPFIEAACGKPLSDEIRMRHQIAATNTAMLRQVPTWLACLPTFQRDAIVIAQVPDLQTQEELQRMERYFAQLNQRIQPPPIPLHLETHVQQLLASVVRQSGLDILHLCGAVPGYTHHRETIELVVRHFIAEAFTELQQQGVILEPLESEPSSTEPPYMTAWRETLFRHLGGVLSLQRDYLFNYFEQTTHP